ncbi:hypothetical protein ADK94_09875 [Streptomyces sp. XY593]|nr:hypothetical protein ADK49_18355 [Streptomyces sp. WM6349]KOU89733.1 hypothetical protein ADK94_09875 [Streptomyces sp. XY593]KOU91495.1 hypothetical protein ADK92_30240 [Streptomyces sp. XY533]KOU99443.1 hypothetical protein ADK91_27470 [Streptomyces sp. XY511]KOV42635.1 hypothetical protein ADK98_23675 [Streptomyces sp. H036]
MKASGNATIWITLTGEPFRKIDLCRIFHHQLLCQMVSEDADPAPFADLCARLFEQVLDDLASMCIGQQASTVFVLARLQAGYRVSPAALKSGSHRRSLRIDGEDGHQPSLPNEAYKVSQEGRRVLFVQDDTVTTCDVKGRLSQSRRRVPAIAQEEDHS